MDDHETLEWLRSLKEYVRSKMRRKIKLKPTWRQQAYETTSGKRTEKERQRDRVSFKLLVIYRDVQIKTRLSFVEVYL